MQRLAIATTLAALAWLAPAPAQALHMPTNPKARAALCAHNPHVPRTWCKRPAPPGGYPIPAPAFPETPRPLP